MSAAAALAGGEFIFVAFICLLLIRYYQSPLVTLDVSISVYISWVMGFAAVLLLPYDLSLALVENFKSPALVDVWKVIYWVTFMLAWVILPVQMEYHNSGHFTFKEKLLDACRKLFLAALGAFVVFMIYLIYMLVHHASSQHIEGFLMAMSNTYGVFLITILMGSGLVGLPKRLWTIADAQGELNRLYLSATTVEDAFHDARYALEDSEAEVHNLVQRLEKAGTHSSLAVDLGLYVDILKAKVDAFHFTKRSSSRAFSKNALAGTVSKDYSTKEALVGLHAQLINAQLRVRAAERRWEVLIYNCKKHKELESKEISEELVDSWCLMPVGNNGQTQPATGWRRSVAVFFATIHRIWLTKLFSVSCRIAAIVCGFFSILILWGELVMSSKLHSPIGYMLGAYSPTPPSPIIVQSIAFLILAYMSICTYWTIFRINIGWSYRLQGPQLSAPSSLIFNGEYLSRLQFALSYNFLLTLNISSTHWTAFSSLMDNIDIIPVFGTSFTVYVPIIMIIIAVITLLDGCGRLLKLLGIESEDAIVYTRPCALFRRSKDATEGMDEDLLERYKQGKLMVENELRQWSNSLKSLPQPVKTATLPRRSNGSDSSTSATTASGSGFLSSFAPKPLGTTKANGYANLDESGISDDFDEGPYADERVAERGGSSKGSGKGGFMSNFKISGPAVASNGNTGSNASKAKPLSQQGNPNKSKDIFDLDDDEETIYMGRYSDS